MRDLSFLSRLLEYHELKSELTEYLKTFVRKDEVGTYLLTVHVDL